ncbi:MAG: fumarylacetoacetate hydrolase family protein [Ilumatobacteraceae bacterium]|jgi:2-keto-4-pentenoate hydratase/2-oxohepta-3-ene-1,7-dioic acid hydratase in catechol pathway
MLRFGSIGGRAHAFFGDDRQPQAVDIERTLGLPADPMQCIAHWDELRTRLDDLANGASRPVQLTELDCPIPRPSQLFAVGLNYRKHAEEMNSPIPNQPLVFAKFPSSLNSPTGTVTIVGETCDYESEVVVVIAKGGRDIPASEAWNHIAGLCAGQDVSDRGLQYAGTPPQFSLGKSRRGFSPIGPWVGDVHEHPRRDTLTIGCSVNGEQRQSTEIHDMIFSIDQVVAFLSSIVELRSGDLIYTGSPFGVGHGMKPPKYLQPGDVIETTLEGVGTIINHCV